MIKTRKVNKHTPDCVGVKNYRSGLWNSPWVLLGIPFHSHKDEKFTAGFLKRTKGGNQSHAKRNMTTSYWLRAVCNDGRCPAVLLIEADSIIQETRKP